uniref:E3 ubiquitin-protein ligase n=1 Tax=Heterorhabditis bacteriophora TaxID=37862 RepID=A0A1I7WHP0_HETBA
MILKEVSDDGQTPVSSSAGSMEPGELRGSVTVRSRQHSGELFIQVYSDTKNILESIWSSDLIRSYVIPERSSMVMSLHTTMVLNGVLFLDTRRRVSKSFFVFLQRAISKLTGTLFFSEISRNLDHDADTLFDNVLDWLKEKEKNSYTLPAVHLATEVLMPEIIIRCLQKLQKQNHARQ